MTISDISAELWRWMPHVLSVPAALIMTWLACHPIFAFTRRGWWIKRDDILSSLNEAAKRQYLLTFLQRSPSDACRAFDELYETRYGRYRLKVPVALLLCTTLPITFLMAESAVARLTGCAGTATLIGPAGCVTLPPKALAALAGAYTWVVSGLTTSAARYTLPPKFVLASTLRMIVAAPLGYAIAEITPGAGVGVFLAFSIGAFPIETVTTILQRLANNKLSLDLGTNANDKIDDPVTKLSGINPPIADLLQDGNIMTIAQLAYADPVQLSMRTNLDFDVIVDLVDQALAWVYLGDKLATLRPNGLRGALDIRALRMSLDSGDEATKDRANKTFAAAVAATGLNADGLYHAFEQIAALPNTSALALFA